MTPTKISWCTDVWNPVVGCTKVSAGCDHCYAAKVHNQRFKAKKKGKTEGAKNLPVQYDVPFNVIQLKPERLEMPLRWRRPRRIFVNSMSDLFHEQVPDEFIDRVFAVMALAPQHTFQVLTKRPERMAEYILSRPEAAGSVHGGRTIYPWPSDTEWPLPNVHLGTSVEDQRAADERIPHLLRTPATVRFLSCEPLLGRVELSCLSGWDTAHAVKGLGRPILGTDGIGWVIAGGESGPGHRPMKTEWMRSIRDQCKSAGVAFFGKQASGFRNEMPLPEDLQIREFPNTEQEINA